MPVAPGNERADTGCDDALTTPPDRSSSESTAVPPAVDSRPLSDPVNHLDLMARQGFALQLTSYDARGWRATFYVTGMEHSPTSATGPGWELTPWHATAARGVGGATTGQPR